MTDAVKGVLDTATAAADVAALVVARKPATTGSPTTSRPTAENISALALERDPEIDSGPATVPPLT